MTQAQQIQANGTVALAIVAAAARKQAASKQAASKQTARKPVKQAVAKPASTRAQPVVKPPKATWNADMIGNMAGNIIAISGAASAAEALAKDIKFFRENKIKLGASVRTCGICQEFVAAFTAAGVKNKATVSNYLSALRGAINDGKTFNLNPSRAAAGSKGGNKGKAGNKSSWKTSGEVLAALAKKIEAVKSDAGKLWDKAMSDAPAGFEAALIDFLASQGEETESAK